MWLLHGSCLILPSHLSVIVVAFCDTTIQNDCCIVDAVITVSRSILLLVLCAVAIIDVMIHIDQIGLLLLVWSCMLVAINHCDCSLQYNVKIQLSLPLPAIGRKKYDRHRCFLHYNVEIWTLSSHFAISHNNYNSHCRFLQYNIKTTLVFVASCNMTWQIQYSLLLLGIWHNNYACCIELLSSLWSLLLWYDIKMISLSLLLAQYDVFCIDTIVCYLTINLKICLLASCDKK